MPSDKANPFTTAMDQAKQVGDEFSRLFARMPMPQAPDMGALMALQQRNLEALSSANRIALEGAQAVARRHMEIMQQTMSELTDSLRVMAAVEAPGEKAATQAELMKRAYEHAVANTREMTDLIQNASSEAVGQLNHRIVEAMEEIKALAAKAGGAKP